VKIKICGITSYEDARLALDAGCDGLGFNFYPASPRYVEPRRAREIIRKLPPLVVTVGLFVNGSDPRSVSTRARAAGVAVLQLHGDESPEFCRRLARFPLIKALRIGAGFSAAGLADYPVQAVLLDSRDPNLFGGTGRPFDWRLAASVKELRPVILAGGLRPDNVADAIRAVRPYGVDVSSGVEESPGKKDRRKLAAFIEEVRNACKEPG
jgi:phosphoribosylanthranilate isomerase